MSWTWERLAPMLDAVVHAATRRRAAAAGRLHAAEGAVLGLLYRLYEHQLLGHLRTGPLPRHVGVILDGNRRYAQQAQLTSGEAYRRGADKVDDVLEWCDTLGIPQVTAWVLSIENLDRPAAEVGPLLEVIEQKITHLASHAAISGRQRRIRAVGHFEILPASLRATIADAERTTAHHTGCVLNVAVGYSGRQEIADAVRSVVRTHYRPGGTVDELMTRLTPEEIGRHMYAAAGDDPDLIIRTSGEIRLSGFLLWQSAFSEYYFCDVYWPDFRRVDFLRALRSYQQRQRRFGR